MFLSWRGYDKNIIIWYKQFFEIKSFAEYLKILNFKNQQIPQVPNKKDAIYYHFV